MGGGHVESGRAGSAGRQGWQGLGGWVVRVYVGRMVSSEANHKYTNASRVGGLASLVDVPANPEKQRAREGKREEEEKKKEDG